jgi:hypothetical protein
MSLRNQGTIVPIRAEEPCQIAISLWISEEASKESICPVPAIEPAEEVKDIKEGQLVESDQVKGTIEEVIDMDF